MPIDFFRPACQQVAPTVTQFGVCDDQNGQPAYTDTQNPDRWVAAVENRAGLALIFTAVDNCLLQNTDEPGRGRCDGMLTSDRHLYFIELKDEQSGWLQRAIGQLESTIQFFLESHGPGTYRHRKAFACNRRHRHFQEVDNEFNLRFFRQYGFRIDVQAAVVVI